MQVLPPPTPFTGEHEADAGAAVPPSRRRRLWSHVAALRNEALVAVLSAGSTVAAFLLQIAIFHATGTGTGTDAYFASIGIVQVVLAVAVATVSGAVTPLLARLDRQDRDNLTALLIVAVLTLSVPVMALAWTTASTWVPRLFPGFEGEGLVLATGLARLMVMATPFALLTAILSAYNYAGRHFVENEAITFGFAIALTVAVFFGVAHHGVIAAGWLMLGRFVFQALLQARRLRPDRLRAGAPFLRRIVMLGLILVAANIVLKIDPLVDRIILSTATAGTLSVFAFAQTVYVAAAGVIGQALGSTAVPALAISYRDRDRDGFLATFHRNLSIIAIVSLLAIAAAIFVVPPVAGLLTGNQIGTEPDTLRGLLVPLAGMPLFAALGALLANAFYVMEDTRTPTVIMMVNVVIFVTSKFFIYRHFGLTAYCLLISLYWFANALLMMLFVQRKVRAMFPRPDGRAMMAGPEKEVDR